MEYLELLQKLQGIELYKDVSLKNFCSYGTGGNAKLIVYPKNYEELYNVYIACKDYPYVVVGNGSNLLISDRGYNGVVICTKRLNKITVRGNVIIAECGAKLLDVVKEAEMNSLGGLEFSVGIPATVGGAVAMNAGCFNKNVGDLVSYVKTVNGVFNREDCGFSYRSSNFLNKNIIYCVCLMLKVSEYDIIEEKLNKFTKLRVSKQPKGRSCGSVFRNEDYFAGKLIDEAGLKGVSVGGAQVSEKHANFIINKGNATSFDVYTLIKKVQSTVEKRTGIKMKEELIYIGDFDEVDV